MEAGEGCEAEEDEEEGTLPVVSQVWAIRVPGVKQQWLPETSVALNRHRAREATTLNTCWWQDRPRRDPRFANSFHVNLHVLRDTEGLWTCVWAVVRTPRVQCSTSRAPFGQCCDNEKPKLRAAREDDRWLVSPVVDVTFGAFREGLS